ncbi:Armadillo-type fold [Babesia duncani]|uniref:Armadillo-type fold n=1 Tax=Babesia duncani TaxID=323732 RepID=A0AAD9UN93_9APIC|nr:Armadillo-type fold [Babesia duncani]
MMSKDSGTCSTAPSCGDLVISSKITKGLFPGPLVELKRLQLVANSRVQVLLKRPRLKHAITSRELVDVEILKKSITDAALSVADAYAYDIALVMLSCLQGDNTNDVDLQVVNHIVNSGALLLASEVVLEFLVNVCIWAVETRKGMNLVHLAHELLVKTDLKTVSLELYLQRLVVTCDWDEDVTSVYWQLRELQLGIKRGHITLEHMEKLKARLVDLARSNCTIFIHDEVACLVAQLEQRGIHTPVSMSTSLKVLQKLLYANCGDAYSGSLTVPKLVRIALGGKVDDRKRALDILGMMGKAAVSTYFKRAIKLLLSHSGLVGLSQRGARWQLDYGLLTVAAIHGDASNILNQGFDILKRFTPIAGGYGNTRIVPDQQLLNDLLPQCSSILNACTAAQLRLGISPKPIHLDIVFYIAGSNRHYHQWVLDFLLALVPGDFHTALVALMELLFLHHPKSRKHKLGYGKGSDARFRGICKLFCALLIERVGSDSCTSYRWVIQELAGDLATNLNGIFKSYTKPIVLEALESILKVVNDDKVVYREAIKCLERAAFLISTDFRMQLAISKLFNAALDNYKCSTKLVTHVVATCICNIEAHVHAFFGLIKVLQSRPSPSMVKMLCHLVNWLEPCYDWDLKTIDASVQFLKQLNRARFRYLRGQYRQLWVSRLICMRIRERIRDYKALHKHKLQRQW